jgi:DNA-binding IclR family transcriptional regulator
MQARMAPAKPKSAPKESLKSLTKVVQILECFSPIDRTLSLGDICGRTKYPKSTTHRLLSSMGSLGLIDQERDRYRLGLKLFGFGNVALANMDLHREARPTIDALSRLSGCIVHLAVFDGTQAVVIHRADSASEAPNQYIEAAPVHCTSVGKAILAYQPPEVVKRVISLGLKRYTDTTLCDAASLRTELSRIREQGYAVDNSEHQPGVQCIGAPIRDQNGRVFAGISVSGSSWHAPLPDPASLSKVVIHHAGVISTALGFR